MSDQPIGKDGGERVLARFKREFKIWRRHVEPNIADFKSKPSGHNFVDMFVEGCREVRAAYFNGHVIAWSLMLNVLLGAAVVALLVL